MPDTLTPAERAAIAAFSENQVQRIDPGVLGGVYPNYVYLASGNRAHGCLVARNADWAKRKRAAVKAAKGGGAAR